MVAKVNGAQKYAAALPSQQILNWEKSPSPEGRRLTERVKAATLKYEHNMERPPGLGRIRQL